ncbi:hypothetical protein EVAR_36617_1 [Eumeta japonica]|uniref:Uncharacterized protein n=1 Tax=Eumeta variegata TaxID=151549 RepID=A0A4C1ZNW0_EUMVA|nr:hypothetical protein EVAR_36617_1 [Eumeta japonica]
MKVGYGRRKMRVGSMKWRCDRCVVRVECLGKIDVQMRCGFKEGVVTRAERGILRWFGHLERMNEGRPTEQIYRARVCEGKVGKGRPTKSYADHIGGVSKKGQT